MAEIRAIKDLELATDDDSLTKKPQNKWAAVMDLQKEKEGEGAEAAAAAAGAAAAAAAKPATRAIDRNKVPYGAAFYLI